MVELMVAMTMLSVAFLGAATAHSSCLRLTKTSRETNAAVAELQTVMEELMVLPPEDIITQGTESGTGIEFPMGEHPLLEDRLMLATFPDIEALYGSVAAMGPNDDVPDPLEVVLSTSWTDFGGRSRTMTFSSRKTR